MPLKRRAIFLIIRIREIFFIFIINKEFCMPEKNQLSQKKEPVRIGFIDNVRGIVVLMYMLSHLVTGINTVVVIPEWFVHGGRVEAFPFWSFFNFSFMDLGQPIFLTLIGLTCFYAFNRRLENGESVGKAALRAVQRNCVLFTAATLWMYVMTRLDGRDIDWDILHSIAFTGLLVLPFALIKPVRKLPSLRLALGAAAFVLYQIFHEKLAFLNGNEGGAAACFGYLGIVLVASAVGDYLRKDPFKYALLTSGLIFAAVFAINFWGPAVFRAYNAAFMVASLALVNGMLFVLYALDKLLLKGKPIPLLSTLGKNMLFFFIFSMSVGGAAHRFIVKSPLSTFGFWTAVAAYILVYLLIAAVFQKKKIIIKL
jgi:hypothetical protein